MYDPTADDERNLGINQLIDVDRRGHIFEMQDFAHDASEKHSNSAHEHVESEREEDLHDARLAEQEREEEALRSQREEEERERFENELREFEESLVLQDREDRQKIEQERQSQEREERERVELEQSERDERERLEFEQFERDDRERLDTELENRLAEERAVLDAERIADAQRQETQRRLEALVRAEAEKIMREQQNAYRPHDDIQYQPSNFKNIFKEVQTQVDEFGRDRGPLPLEREDKDVRQLVDKLNDGRIDLERDVEHNWSIEEKVLDIKFDVISPGSSKEAVAEVKENPLSGNGTPALGAGGSAANVTSTLPNPVQLGEKADDDRTDFDRDIEHALSVEDKRLELDPNIEDWRLRQIRTYQQFIERTSGVKSSDGGLAEYKRDQALAGDPYYAHLVARPDNIRLFPHSDNVKDHHNAYEWRHRHEVHEPSVVNIRQAPSHPEHDQYMQKMENVMECLDKLQTPTLTPSLTQDSERLQNQKQRSDDEGGHSRW